MTLDMFGSRFLGKKMSSKNRFAGGKLSTKNNEQTRWFPVQTVALHNFISPSVFFFRGSRGDQTGWKDTRCNLHFSVQKDR